MEDGERLSYRQGEFRADMLLQKPQTQKVTSLPLWAMMSPSPPTLHPQPTRPPSLRSIPPRGPEHDGSSSLPAGARSYMSPAGFVDQLIPFRYRFRSPKYYRGPLHPHQPPPPSSPVSRLFQPGPFSLPRLSQYYTSTLAHDLMVLSYTHTVPGTPPPPPPQRLRGWDDSSPYHKNRPLRGPRGTASSRLPLLRKDIDFTNVPKLERVTVAMLVPSAHKEQGKLPVAGFVLQNVTGQRATVHLAKRGTVPAREGNLRQRYEQKKGRPIAVSANLTGEMMWHFMGTLTGVVLPRIKEWKGMKGSSGDRSGNFMLSLTSDVVGTWPEIAINYDS